MVIFLVIGASKFEVSYGYYLSNTTRPCKCLRNVKNSPASNTLVFNNEIVPEAEVSLHVLI